MKTENINNTQNVYSQYQNKTKPAAKGNAGDAKEVTEKVLSNPVDSYTPSAKALEGAANAASIEKLWADTNAATSAIRSLVAKLIGREDAAGQAFWAVRAQGGMKHSDVDFKELQKQLDEIKSGKLSEADRAEAQAMVAEDGFFGVNQTSQRLMDFAKALVGEDASDEKKQNMRNAVQAGFDDVAKLFGGFDRLPDVSKQTHEKTMKLFDEWMGVSAAEKDDK